MSVLVACVVVLVIVAALVSRSLQNRAAREELPAYQRIRQTLYRDAPAVDLWQEPGRVGPSDVQDGPPALVPAFRTPRPGETHVVTVVGRSGPAADGSEAALPAGVVDLTAPAAAPGTADTAVASVPSASGGLPPPGDDLLPVAATPEPRPEADLPPADSDPAASVRALAAGGIATVGAAGGLAQRAEERAPGRLHRRRRIFGG